MCSQSNAMSFQFPSSGLRKYVFLHSVQKELMLVWIRNISLIPHTQKCHSRDKRLEDVGECIHNYICYITAGVMLLFNVFKSILQTKMYAQSGLTQKHATGSKGMLVVV